MCARTSGWTMSVVPSASSMATVLLREAVMDQYESVSRIAGSTRNCKRERQLRMSRQYISNIGMWSIVRQGTSTILHPMEAIYSPSSTRLPTKPDAPQTIAAATNLRGR